MVSVTDFAEVNGDVTIKVNTTSRQFTDSSISASGVTVPVASAIDANTNFPDFSVANFGATVFGFRLGAAAPGTSSATGAITSATVATPVVKFEKVGESIHLVATNLEAKLATGGVSVSATGGSIGVILTDENPDPAPTAVTPGIVLYATGTLMVSVTDFAEVNGDVTIKVNTTSRQFTDASISASGVTVPVASSIDEIGRASGRERV